PGRGDPVHVLRAPHRQAGTAEGRGWGSPRLRLVTENAMSRIGKLPVTVPAGVETQIDGQTISVKGPKGNLSYTAPELVEISVGGGASHIKRHDAHRVDKAQHG